MTDFIEELFGYTPRSIMVFAIGGGGDIVTAAVIALWLRRVGNIDVYIGSFVWERLIIDPEPGPIPFDNFKSVKMLGENSLVVTGNTLVERGNRVFKPQVACVSGIVGEPIYVVDLWGGVAGVKKGIQEVCDKLGLEGFIAVDVGGDVLAVGNEENLWSPLADSIGLAAFGVTKEDSILAVHGLGCDGELEQEYLLRRISLIASKGGFRVAKSLTKYESWYLEKILTTCISEASRIPLLAYKGFYGEHPIRLGSRKVFVTPVHSITFFLDLHKVYSLSPLAKNITDTISLDQANRILNTMCIVTEYDLEKELRKYNLSELDGAMLYKVRKELKKKMCGDTRVYK